MCGAGVGAERGCVSGACGGEGRGESEEEPGDEGDSESEKQDGHIRGGVHCDVGIALAEKGDKSASGGEGEAQSEKTAREGKEEGFDEALADDACAAGAECEAGGDFALASGGAGEEEVGEVGAGDEKDQSHDCHENPERVTILTAEGRYAVGRGEEGDGDAIDFLLASRGD